MSAPPSRDYMAERWYKMGQADGKRWRRRTFREFLKRVIGRVVE